MIAIRHRYFSATWLAIALASVLFVISLAMYLDKTVFAAAPIVRSDEHILTVYDDGAKKGFLTKADTLKQALKDAGFNLSPNDITEPALDQELIASNYNVTIYRARPVLIVDGTTRTKIITAYHTGEQIAKQAGITLNDEDKADLQYSGDIVADGALEKMVITRATPFKLVLYGETTTAYTQAKTVGGMLADKGIKLVDKDHISAKLNAAIVPNMEIEIWREGVQTITRKEAVKYSVRQIKDANRPVGYSKIQTPGMNGQKLVTYEITIKNGKEVKKKVIQTVVTKVPIERVEIVGTKNNYSASLNEWLSALRQCEAGGSYSRNSGNGYYGAYQFSIATWNSTASAIGRLDLVGVLPSEASPADQDEMIIANTNRTAGLRTQNPGCYNSLGLSNYPPTS